MPKNMVKKISEKHAPEDPTQSILPDLTRLANDLPGLGLFLPMGQVTMAASSKLNQLLPLEELDL
jgi:hypothetical protein